MTSKSLVDCMLTRRSFVQQCSTAALGVSVSSLTHASSAKPLSCDTAIIGAGLAGLNAALKRQAQGDDVLVLEARARVGGRLETLQRGDLRLDLGAVEVGNRYQRLVALAKSLNVALNAPAGARVPGLCIALDGKLLNENQWAASALNPMRDEKLRALPPSAWLSGMIGANNPLQSISDWRAARHQTLDVPLQAYLQNAGASPEQLRMMEIASNYNDFAHVSALDVLRRDTLRKASGTGVLLIDGGSQALPDAMAKALKRAVQHDAIVSINFQRGRYVLQSASGSVHCKRLIIAAPPAPSKMLSAHLDFVRPIAPLFNRPLTHVTTLHFRPRTKFWEADGLSPNMWIDGALERMFAVANASGAVERLIVWINGRQAQALDAMGSELVHYVQLELARLRPSTRGQLDLIATKQWGSDPLAGGAYAEIAAGDCVRVQKAEDALKALPKHFAFAGEHCVSSAAGMEAALASGEWAAAHLNK
jgi:monoamine oxidase